MLDLDLIRADLPNPGAVIHLDNAGSSPSPDPVLEVMHAHLKLEQELGGYRAQDLTVEAQDRFYTQTARMLGCQPQEIAFTDSATRSYDMAVYGMPIRPGQTVLLGPTEYASNHISIIQRCRSVGARWQVMPSDENSLVDSEALADLLMHLDVALVTVSHVPTNGAAVQPIAEIGKLTRAAGVPFVVDACQSVGQLALDVEMIGCDVLSFTGRKFLRGPRGTGGLFVRSGFMHLIEPPMLDLFSAELISVTDYRMRDDCRRFETWEYNVAAKIGLARAIQYYLALGVEAVQERVQMLAARLTESLSTIANLRIHDSVPGQCGIVTLTHPAISPVEMHRMLAKSGVFSTASGADNSWLDKEGAGSRSVLRLSPHYFLSEDEIDRAVSSLEKIVSRHQGWG
jgi:selenocysteine lyase/cysteine desulfurase